MRMARWQNRLNYFCLCRVGSCPCLCLLSSHSSLYNAMFVPLTATFSLLEKAQNRITIAESALLLVYYCTMVVFFHDCAAWAGLCCSAFFCFCIFVFEFIFLFVACAACEQCACVLILEIYVLLNFLLSLFLYLQLYILKQLGGYVGSYISSSKT